MSDPATERAAVVAASANRFVRALHAPLGVFAVLGDWDGWGKRWPAQLQKVLAGGSLRVLRGETVDIEVPGGGHVALFGVGGGPGSHPVRPTNSSRPGLRLVITHHPDRAAALLRRGEADLVLVGHTHGGQVVLPGLGALITHSKLGLAGGKHVLHGIPLLISRGIGLRGNSAPRIRFNCPPEISWVTVKRP